MKEAAEAAVLIIIGLAAYWFFILRPGRLHFWRVAAKYPDDAYGHFKADTSWKVFEEGLPENFRSNFPKSEWVGPFRLTVPKLGGKTIVVFGKRLDFERSQNEFLAKFKGGTKRL